VLTDDEFKEWGRKQHIDLKIVTQNSAKVCAFGLQDFVWIDGDHTGAGVKADIEIWKDHCQYIGFHDYADRGKRNKHMKYYEDVVAEISAAKERYGWVQFGERGRSDIVFKTGIGESEVSGADWDKDVDEDAWQDAWKE